MQSIQRAEFQLPGQTGFYRGKVREVYTLGDKMILVATDRISAFDYVLSRSIPFKGQVLNQIAAYFLAATSDVAPNWLIGVPDPNVTVGWACEPYQVEMVVRGYLTGHAFRLYQSGMRKICGVLMPEGMRENDPFPKPIITPTTKAAEGHDEDISREEIIRQQIVEANEYEQLENYSLQLYQRGVDMAKKRGLILVDTKYEFGKKDGSIFVIDEIHTPDSSRYFYADGYEERQSRGEKQPQLSKEFVREWLIARGFQGKDGQIIPNMPDEFVQEISERYIQLYEKATGLPFIKPTVDVDPLVRIEQNILRFLKENP